MNRLRHAFLALALLALNSCATVPPLDPELQVLVFNIHAGKDPAGNSNLDGVADVIRQTGADIVLLQEVDRGTQRSGGEDQLQRLVDLLNADGKSTYAPAFGKSLDFQGGEYGIAVLVRGSVARSTVEALAVQPVQERAGGSHEPRAALLVEAETPLGPVTMINTHLDASAEEHYRLQESARVVEMVNRAAGADGLIVGGDFNAEPGSRTYQQIVFAGLRDAWPTCGAGEGFTYPADQPIKRIDYLFLAPPVRCTGAQVLDSRVSDHRPLLVTITR